MPLVQAKSDARVFLDEDYSYDEVSEDFIGRKGVSLFQLREMDVPVPPFLCISGSIFTEYIAECLRSTITGKVSDDEIREKVSGGSIPLNSRNEIMEGYSRLSGFADAWVSVRSSIVLPVTHRELVFAGMLDTVLNVKGLDALAEAIRRVYASAFSPKVAQYLHEHDLTIADIKVALVVQKMVQAEASGVVFTVDPISQNDDFLTIEAVFGLGDVIANGEITPDQYTIEKKNLEFREKKIIPQEWMMVRKAKPKEGEPDNEKVKISPAWQQQQKLENKYVKELSKIAITVEKKAGEPQDLEWVFEGGRIWLLQAAPVQLVNVPATTEAEVKIDSAIITAAKEITKRETAKQNTKKELETQKAAKKAPAKQEEVAPQPPPASQQPPVPTQREVLTQKPLSRQVLHASPTPTVKISPLPGEKLLLTGIGASEATFRGKVVIATNADELKTQRNIISKNTVLVLSDHFPEVDAVLGNVGAVVVDTGGTTSDIATVCRERSIPCIMGSYVASKMLQHGENVLVDGAIGAIYGIREFKAPPPEKKVPPVPLPKSKPQKKKPPKETPAKPTFIPTATKILCDLSDSYLKGNAWKKDVLYSDGIATLEIEDIYKKINMHPEAAAGEGAAFAKTLASHITQVCEETDGKQLVVSIGNCTVSDYKKLPKGADLEKVESGEILDQTIGLPRLLQHPKELQQLIKAIKHVRNNGGWRTVSVAVGYPASPDHLVEFKKQLSSQRLRRSSTFSLYLAIDTPSEAMILEDFIKSEIDGVIVNIRNLAKHMMAPTLDDASILKLIENMKQVSAGLPFIVQLNKDSEKLLHKSVKLGFSAIAVPPSDIQIARNIVAGLEHKALMKS